MNSGSTKNNLSQPKFDDSKGLSQIEKMAMNLLPDLALKLTPLLLFIFPGEFDESRDIQEVTFDDVVTSITLLMQEFLRLESIKITQKLHPISEDDQKLMSGFARFMYIFCLRGGTEYLLDKFDDLASIYEDDRVHRILNWMREFVKYEDLIQIEDKERRRIRKEAGKSLAESVYETSEVLQLNIREETERNVLMPAVRESIQDVMNLIRKHEELNDVQASSFAIWLVEMRRLEPELYEEVVQFLCGESDFIAQQAARLENRKLAISYAKIHLLIHIEDFTILPNTPLLFRALEDKYPGIFGIIDNILKLASQKEFTIDHPENLFTTLNTYLQLMRNSDEDLFIFTNWALLPSIDSLTKLCQTIESPATKSLVIELLLFATEDENLPYQLGLNTDDTDINRAIRDAIDVWKASSISENIGTHPETIRESYLVKEYGLSDLLENIQDVEDLHARIKKVTQFFNSFVELVHRYNEMAPEYRQQRQTMLEYINRAIRRMANVFIVGKTTKNLTLDHNGEQKRRQLALRLHVATCVIKMYTELDSSRHELLQIRELLDSPKLLTLVQSCEKFCKIYTLSMEN